MQPRREAYKRSIPLISGGYYAKAAFPDGLITVYPWDSRTDEWFLEKLRKTSEERDYAILEVAEKVSALKGLKYGQLLESDAEEIVMVSRAMSTGLQVIFEAECPACNANNKNEIKIPDGLTKVSEKKPDFNGIETITLPENLDVIEFKHLNIADLIKVNQRSDDSKKEVPTKLALGATCLLSVNGNGTVDDKGARDGAPTSLQDAIVYLEALSPVDIEYFYQQRVELYPHLDRKVVVECDKCGHRFDYVLRLTTDFFRRGL